MQVEQANSHNTQLVHCYSGNSNQFVGHCIFTSVVLKWYNLLARLGNLQTAFFSLACLTLVLLNLVNSLLCIIIYAVIACLPIDESKN